MHLNWSREDYYINSSQGTVRVALNLDNPIQYSYISLATAIQMRLLIQPLLQPLSSGVKYRNLVCGRVRLTLIYGQMQITDYNVLFIKRKQNHVLLSNKMLEKKILT